MNEFGKMSALLRAFHDHPHHPSPQRSPLISFVSPLHA